MKPHDIYEEQNLDKVLEHFNKSKQPIILFYKFKRLLLFLLRFDYFEELNGYEEENYPMKNTICCFQITFCESDLDNSVFEQVFQNNVDWYAWEKISKSKGDFIYVPNLLICHRIHAESTTS